MAHGPHHHIHDVSAPVAQEPALSFLRLSAGQRLIAAAMTLAALWAAVFWALQL
jgi:hypothetical protein